MFCKQHDAYQVDRIGIEYLDGLYSYALVLSGNRAMAEDLVQETYVRAMRAVDRLGADSNMKSWFFTILRNTWLNPSRLRRSGLHDFTLCTFESSRELGANTVEREQLRAAIQKLPVEWAEVIMLREYENLSCEEIAQIVSCPAETVMSRLREGRSKLRLLLSEHTSAYAPAQS